MNNNGGGAGLRKLNSKLTTKFISEAGTKLQNKDYFGFVELDNFACWAIAESFDNDQDVISAQIVVDTVLDMFTRKPTLSKSKLKRYIKQAHNQLKVQSGKFQLKASIMIVASDYKNIRYVHCGNCRLHIFRGSNIFTKSQDQSLYQDMLNRGITTDDGENGMSESRNLFDFLGKQGNIHISASKKLLLLDEDIIVLTTWGFWEKITTIEMLDALEEIKSPMQYLDELQDLFLSKQQRHVNNYTVSTIFVFKTFQEKGNIKKVIIIITIIVIILLIIIVIITWLVIRNNNLKRAQTITSVEDYEQKGDIFVNDDNYERALEEYGISLNEVKNLKEKSGKKAKENKDIKARLENKRRVAQLVVDADQLFSEGKYTQAKLNYNKAIKESKYNLDFYETLNLKEIQNKISKTDDFKYTDELLNLADTQVDFEDYENALQNYIEARKLAVSSKNKEAEKDIKLKLDAVQSKVKSSKTEKDKIEHEEKLKRAQKVELDADISSTSSDFTGASAGYSDALAMYVEIGDLEKAASVEKKIGDMKAKIKEIENKDQAKIAENYIKSGDSYILENNFDKAIEFYNNAMSIYLDTEMKDEEANLKTKMIDLEAKKREFSLKSKILEIGIMEDEADKFLASSQYARAKEKYRQAQALYQNINQTDKVLAVEEKLKAIQQIELDLLEQIEKEKEEEKQKEIARIEYTAKTFVLSAQKALLEKKYANALGFFNRAKELYESTENFEKLEELTEKIVETEKLLAGEESKD